MSGPRYVARVFVRGDEVVRVMDCGHEQSIDRAKVPKAWLVKGQIDLRHVLRATAHCTVKGCGEPGTPKEAA